MAISRIPRRDESDSGKGELTDDLVDELLADYIDWRQDAKAAARAYAIWSGASREEEDLRFCTYMAALDQEESSARKYALVVAEARRALAA